MAEENNNIILKYLTDIIGKIEEVTGDETSVDTTSQLTSDTIEYLKKYIDRLEPHDKTQIETHIKSLQDIIITTCKQLDEFKKYKYDYIAFKSLESNLEFATTKLELNVVRTYLVTYIKDPKINSIISETIKHFTNRIDTFNKIIKYNLERNRNSSVNIRAKDIEKDEKDETDMEQTIYNKPNTNTSLDDISVIFNINTTDDLNSVNRDISKKIKILTDRSPQTNEDEIKMLKVHQNKLKRMILVGDIFNESMDMKLAGGSSIISGSTESDSNLLKIDLYTLIDEFSNFNDELFSRFLTLALNPKNFCDIWYSNSAWYDKDIFKNTVPKENSAYNKLFEILEIKESNREYILVNYILNIFFIKIQPSEPIKDQSYDLFIDEIKEIKKYVKRDTYLYKTLFIQNIKNNSEKIILDIESNPKYNGMKKTEIEDNIRYYENIKINKFKTNDDEYIFNYSLLHFLLNAIPDIRHHTQDGQSIYKMNIEKIKNDKSKVYGINVNKRYKNLEYYYKKLDKSKIHLKYLMPILNYEINKDKIKEEYYKLIKENIRVLTYVKERNDTRQFNFTGIDGDNYKNPRYTIKNKDIKLTNDISFYNFGLSYFNYPKAIGLKDPTNPVYYTKTPEYRNFDLKLGVDFVNAPKNKNYIENYNLGIVNGYYTYDVGGEAIAHKSDCGDVLLKKLIDGESVIIIGNGQSGSGKTSTLINYRDKDGIDTPGIFPCIANRLINPNKALYTDNRDALVTENLNTDFFNSIKLQMVNIYVKLEKTLERIEDLKQHDYLLYDIVIGVQNVLDSTNKPQYKLTNLTGKIPKTDQTYKFEGGKLKILSSSTVFTPTNDKFEYDTANITQLITEYNNSNPLNRSLNINEIKEYLYDQCTGILYDPCNQKPIFVPNKYTGGTGDTVDVNGTSRLLFKSSYQINDKNILLDMSDDSVPEMKDFRYNYTADGTNMLTNAEFNINTGYIGIRTDNNLVFRPPNRKTNTLNVYNDDTIGVIKKVEMNFISFITADSTKKWILKDDHRVSLADVIAFAFDNVREVEPTKNNPNSSRSHILVCVSFEKQKLDKQGKREDVNSKVVICDLAGVEDRFTCLFAELITLDNNIADRSEKYKYRDPAQDNKFNSREILKYDNYVCGADIYNNVTDAKDSLKEQARYLLRYNEYIEYYKKIIGMEAYTKSKDYEKKYNLVKEDIPDLDQTINAIIKTDLPKAINDITEIWKNIGIENVTNDKLKNASNDDISNKTLYSNIIDGMHEFIQTPSWNNSTALSKYDNINNKKVKISISTQTNDMMISLIDILAADIKNDCPIGYINDSKDKSIEIIKAIIKDIREKTTTLNSNTLISVPTIPYFLFEEAVFTTITSNSSSINTIKTNNTALGSGSDPTFLTNLLIYIENTTTSIYLIIKTLIFLAIKENSEYAEKLSDLVVKNLISDSAYSSDGYSNTTMTYTADDSTSKNLETDFDNLGIEPSTSIEYGITNILPIIIKLVNLKNKNNENPITFEYARKYILKPIINEENYKEYIAEKYTYLGGSALLKKSIKSIKYIDVYNPYFDNNVKYSDKYLADKFSTIDNYIINNKDEFMLYYKKFASKYKITIPNDILEELYIDKTSKKVKIINKEMYKSYIIDTELPFIQTDKEGLDLKPIITEINDTTGTADVCKKFNKAKKDMSDKIENFMKWNSSTDYYRLDLKNSEYIGKEPETIISELENKVTKSIAIRPTVSNEDIYSNEHEIDNDILSKISENIPDLSSYNTKIENFNGKNIEIQEELTRLTDEMKNINNEFKENRSPFNKKEDNQADADYRTRLSTLKNEITNSTENIDIIKKFGEKIEKYFTEADKFVSLNSIEPNMGSILLPDILSESSGVYKYDINLYNTNKFSQTLTISELKFVVPSGDTPETNSTGTPIAFKLTDSLVTNLKQDLDSNHTSTNTVARIGNMKMFVDKYLDYIDYKIKFELEKLNISYSRPLQIKYQSQGGLEDSLMKPSSKKGLYLAFTVSGSNVTLTIPKIKNIYDMIYYVYENTNYQMNSNSNINAFLKAYINKNISTSKSNTMIYQDIYTIAYNIKNGKISEIMTPLLLLDQTLTGNFKLYNIINTFKTDTEKITNNLNLQSPNTLAEKTLAEVKTILSELEPLTVIYEKREKQLYEINRFIETKQKPLINTLLYDKEFFDKCILVIEKDFKKYINKKIKKGYAEYIENNRIKDYNEIKKNISNVIRFSQLYYNCVIRRKEGFFINTSLKDMQKFISAIIFNSAKARLTKNLETNNLLILKKQNLNYMDLNDKFYRPKILAYQKIYKNIRLIINKTAKGVPIEFKLNDSDQDFIYRDDDISKDEFGSKYLDKDQVNMKIREIVDLLNELKDISLKEFEYIIREINESFKSKSKDKYTLDENYKVFKIKYVILNLYLLDTLFKIFYGSSTLFSMINMYLGIKLKNDQGNKLQEYFKVTGRTDNLSTIITDYTNESNVIDNLKYFNTKLIHTAKSPYELRLKKEFDTMTSILDTDNDFCKNDKTCNIRDTLFYEDKNGNFMVYILHLIFMMINKYDNFVRDNTKNINNEIYKDGIVGNPSDNIYNPLTYIAPRSDVLKKYKYENEFINYYNFSTPDYAGIIFKIMQDKGEVLDKVNGFGINMNNVIITLFTVINISANPEVPVNNPPTPPFINTNKLKLIYKLLEVKKKLEKNRDTRLAAFDARIKSYQKKIKSKILSYDFYATQFPESDKTYRPTLDDYGSFTDATNLKLLINYIDSNNAATLIGTVDFEKFTQIRDVNNFYYLNDDNFESFSKELEIVSQLNNILPTKYTLGGIYTENIQSDNLTKLNNTIDKIETIIPNLSDKLEELILLKNLIIKLLGSVSFKINEKSLTPPILGAPIPDASISSVSDDIEDVGLPYNEFRYNVLTSIINKITNIELNEINEGLNNFKGQFSNFVNARDETNTTTSRPIQNVSSQSTYIILDENDPEFIKLDDEDKNFIRFLNDVNNKINEVIIEMQTKYNKIDELYRNAKIKFTPLQAQILDIKNSIDSANRLEEEYKEILKNNNDDINNSEVQRALTATTQIGENIDTLTLKYENIIEYASVNFNGLIDIVLDTETNINTSISLLKDKYAKTIDQIEKYNTKALTSAESKNKKAIKEFIKLSTAPNNQIISNAVAYANTYYMAVGNNDAKSKVANKALLYNDTYYLTYTGASGTEEVRDTAAKVAAESIVSANPIVFTSVQSFINIFNQIAQDLSSITSVDDIFDLYTTLPHTENSVIICMTFAIIKSLKKEDIIERAKSDAEAVQLASFDSTTKYNLINKLIIATNKKEMTELIKYVSEEAITRFKIPQNKKLLDEAVKNLHNAIIKANIAKEKYESISDDPDNEERARLEVATLETLVTNKTIDVNRKRLEVDNSTFINNKNIILALQKSIHVEKHFNKYLEILNTAEKYITVANKLIEAIEKQKNKLVVPGIDDSDKENIENNIKSLNVELEKYKKISQKAYNSVRLANSSNDDTEIQNILETIEASFTATPITSTLFGGAIIRGGSQGQQTIGSIKTEIDTQTVIVKKLKDEIEELRKQIVNNNKAIKKTQIDIEAATQAEQAEQAASEAHDAEVADATASGTSPPAPPPPLPQSTISTLTSAKLTLENQLETLKNKTKDLVKATEKLKIMEKIHKNLEEKEKTDAEKSEIKTKINKINADILMSIKSEIKNLKQPVSTDEVNNLEENNINTLLNILIDLGVDVEEELIDSSKEVTKEEQLVKDTYALIKTTQTDLIAIQTPLLSQEIQIADAKTLYTKIIDLDNLKIKAEFSSIVTFVKSLIIYLKALLLISKNLHRTVNTKESISKKVKANLLTVFKALSPNLMESKITLYSKTKSPIMLDLIKKANEIVNVFKQTKNAVTKIIDVINATPVHTEDVETVHEESKHVDETHQVELLAPVVASTQVVSSTQVVGPEQVVVGPEQVVASGQVVGPEQVGLGQLVASRQVVPQTLAKIVEQLTKFKNLVSDLTYTSDKVLKELNKLLGKANELISDPLKNSNESLNNKILSIIKLYTKIINITYDDNTKIDDIQKYIDEIDKITSLFEIPTIKNLLIRLKKDLNELVLQFLYIHKFEQDIELQNLKNKDSLTKEDQKIIADKYKDVAEKTSESLQKTLQHKLETSTDPIEKQKLENKISLTNDVLSIIKNSNTGIEVTKILLDSLSH